jgi:hypothetical protein
VTDVCITNKQTQWKKVPRLLHWSWVKQLHHDFGVNNPTTDERVEPSLLHSRYQILFPEGKSGRGGEDDRLQLVTMLKVHDTIPPLPHTSS